MTRNSNARTRSILGKPLDRALLNIIHTLESTSLELGRLFCSPLYLLLLNMTLWQLKGFHWDLYQIESRDRCTALKRQNTLKKHHVYRVQIPNRSFLGFYAYHELQCFVHILLGHLVDSKLEKMVVCQK